MQRRFNRVSHRTISPGAIHPVVKWAGGKRKLATTILNCIGTRPITRYSELFTGGAAIYCALANRQQFAEAVISDVNYDLISVYRGMRNDVDALIEELDYLQHHHNDHEADYAQEFYLAVRDAWNAGLRTPARFIFLTKTSFNGLWRVNSKGMMNVGWGWHPKHVRPGAKPRILDKDNIQSWWHHLQRTTIFCESALTLMEKEQPPGSLIYLDPPYVGTFDKYTADGFSVERQLRLLSLSSKLEQDGARIVYSNSHHARPLVVQEWPSATIDDITTSYSMNSDGAGRSGKVEVLAYTPERVTSC